MNIQPISNYQYNHQKPTSFQGNWLSKPYAKFVKKIDMTDSFVILRNSIMENIPEDKKMLQRLKYFWNNYSCIVKDEPIKYEFSENIDEARAFAKENFKANNYEIDNLHVANAVNWAISDVINYSGGKLVIPSNFKIKKFEPVKEDTVTVATNNVLRGEISLNSEIFDEVIKNLGSDPLDIITNFFYMKKVIFHELYHTLCNLDKLLNKGGKKIIDDEVNYLEKMTKHADMYVVGIESKLYDLSFIKNAPFIKRFITLLFPNLHKLYIEKGYDGLIKMADDYSKLLAYGDSVLERYNKFVTESKLLTEEEAKVALEISEYAATDVDEFLAETFAHICTYGLNRTPKSAFDQYMKLGGIGLPNFPK